MRRVAIVLVGLLLTAAPVLFEAAPSSAAPTARSPKFVGTYTLTVTLNGGQTVFRKIKLNIHADGTWSVGDGAGGKWSSDGRAITLVNTCCTDVFPGELDGTKTAKGISRWRDQGTWEMEQGGTPAGTWFAVQRA